MKKIWKKINELERKILTVSLVFVMTFMAIQPEMMLYAFNNAVSEIIDAQFHEELAEDKQSANVNLKVKEKVNQEIQSIQLPDGKVLEKAQLQVDGDGSISIDYNVSANGELSYTIAYKNKPSEVAATEEQTLLVEASSAEEIPTLKETIIYKVEDIKSLDAMFLQITADDISFHVGENVDFSQGILIKDEEEKDLTETLNVSITNYNGYVKDVAGKYLIEYSVEHPVSKKTFTFQRNVTIVKKEKSTTPVATANDTTASIKLSSGNASLKEPEKFKLGDKSQEEFNVSISYQSQSSGTNRKLTIYIPQPFTLISNLNTTNVTSAKEIGKEVRPDVTILTIIFQDNANVSTSFDLLIKNDSDALYSLASAKEQDLKFIAEARETESVDALSKDQFTIHIDQLINSDHADSLDMLPLTEYDITYSSRSTIKFANTKNQKIVINKKKMSGVNPELKLFVPSTFNGIELTTLVFINYNVIENGSDNILGSGRLRINKNEELKWLDLSGIDSFQCAYTDRRIEMDAISYSWYLSNDNYLYDNPVTPFESEQEVILGTHKLGKLKADLKNTEDANITITTDRFYSSDKKTANVSQGASSIKNDFIYFDRNVRHKSVTWTYDFPYEIQPNAIKISDSLNVNVKVITNLKKELNFKATANNNGYLLLKVEDSNDYIKQVIIDSPLTTSLWFAFDYSTKTTDENKNPLPKVQEVEIGEKISSSNGSFTSTHIYHVNLHAQTEDLQLSGLDNSGVKVSVGGGETGIMGQDFVGKFNTKSYKKLEMVIEGEKALSLINKVDFARLEEYGKSTMKYISYTTAPNNTRYWGNTSGDSLPLNLPPGEYLNSLKIEYTDITRTSSSFNKSDMNLDSIDRISQTTASNTNGIPEILPLDGSIVNGSYPYRIKLIGDGKEIFNKEGKTYTFISMKEPNIILNEGSYSINGNTTATKIGDTGEKKDVLFRVTSASQQDSTDSKLKNVVFDFQNTDKNLLAMIGKVYLYPYSKQPKILYTTNKNATREGIPEMNVLDFKLDEDEYITSLSITAEEMQGSYSNSTFDLMYFTKRSDAPRILPNGTKLKNAGEKYNVNIDMKASNINGTKQIIGNSSLISGKQDYIFKSESSTIVHDGFSYLGGSFNVHLGLYVNISDTEERNSKNNKVKLVDPTVYFVIDKNYSVDVDRLKSSNPLIADITFKDSSLKDGNSLLKIEYKNYEKKFKDEKKALLEYVDIYLTVKTTVLPETTSPIIFGAVDFSNSMKANDNEFADIVSYGDASYADKDHVFDGVNREYYKLNLNPTTHKILPISSISVGSLAEKESIISKDIIGYDNDTYKQQLNIFTSADGITKDWKLYIPVPKRGQRVKYMNEGIESETKPSEFSLELSNAVEFANLPTGAKIEYTTDKNPSYSLNGTDTGTYKSNPTNYKDVTMVRITIPELKENSRLFPIFTYKVVGNKDALEKQTAFGGGYYNFKLKDSTDYNYPNGGYITPISFSLKDFEISGKVWEDVEDISNDTYDVTDILKSGVEVVATDKNNNQYTIPTDTAGNYSLKVPTSGAVTVTFKAPNKLDVVPEQKYSFVKKGSNEQSSVVDPNSGEARLTLSNKDIRNVNAGLLAQRVILVNTGTVEAKTVIVKKGETAQVPAVTFPTYANITYGQASNEETATVSNDGIVTGNKVGKTTAVVSIPDGNGGTVQDTYTIKVIPAKAPSIDTDSIHIFTGQKYDAKSDVIIKDGEDNVVDIDGNADVKVTINTSSVDTTKPGRYPITYTVKDKFNQPINATRYVNVYGAVQFIQIPSNRTEKINTAYNPVTGAKATYIGLNSDGTPTSPIEVTVTSTANTTTSTTPSDMDIPLHAEVVIKYTDKSGVEKELKSEASENYKITVNGNADIRTSKSDVTVKVGTTVEDIMKLINAEGFMPKKDGEEILPVNWNAFLSFNTNVPENTITEYITVVDPDTGKEIKKEITMTISKNVVIDAPKETDLVVGDSFDPLANVLIKDGDGNVVTLTPAMIVSNNVEVDVDGKTTKPGVYAVEYQYTDKYGNTKREKSPVYVHGKLQFDDTRKDFLQNDSVENINSPDNNKDLAYYIDASGNNKFAILKTVEATSSQTIGKSSQNLIYEHPVNNVEVTFGRAIYVHGKLEIENPQEVIVKVNTKVNPLNGVSASYQRVTEDNKIETIKEVAVTSNKNGEFTSSDVKKEEITLNASIDIAKGVKNTADPKTMIVYFNGMPTISTSKDEITVRLNATEQEIKNMLNAKASVHYAKNTKETDLTSQIVWENLDKVDTSKENATYEILLKVMDADGAMDSKKVTIKTSKDIIIHLPSIDKTIGDTFDPLEGVHVFDGNGNTVDPKDIVIDDSKVDMSKPGEYEVEYTYKDSLGNEKTETNTIRINGELVLEGLKRIDLIAANTFYAPNTAKAYYMNYKGKKVYVQGSYATSIDQRVVGKKSVKFSAVHPIGKKTSTDNQNIYVHGDVEINYPKEIVSGKVNTAIQSNRGVSASYQRVNDDGTITTIKVPVQGDKVSSDKVGIVKGKISMEVEVVPGFINKKDTTVQIGFNGLAFIEGASYLYFEGQPTYETVVKAINANAGMKKMNGSVIDLTSNINYEELKTIDWNKSGTHKVKIVVTDVDGFTSYKEIVIEIKTPENSEGNGTITPPSNSGGNTNTDNPSNNEGTNNNGGTNNNQPTDPDNPEADDNKQNGKIEKDVITVITKDIPISKVKDGITKDLLKGYISATSKNNGMIDFEVTKHNVKNSVGDYEITIRLADGSTRKISIKVSDDALRDVQQPAYGKEDNCISHGITLILLLGYCIFSITMISKRRNENLKLEEALKGYKQQNRKGKK